MLAADVDVAIVVDVSVVVVATGGTGGGDRCCLPWCCCYGVEGGWDSGGGGCEIINVGGSGVWISSSICEAVTMSAACHTNKRNTNDDRQVALYMKYVKQQ